MLAHPRNDVVGNAQQAVRHGGDFLEDLFAKRIVVRPEAPGKIAVQHIDHGADRANARRREFRLAEGTKKDIDADLRQQVHRRRHEEPFARGAFVAARSRAAVVAHADQFVAHAGKFLAHLGVRLRAGQIDKLQRHAALAAQPEQGFKQERFDAAVLAAGAQITHVHGHADGR